MKNVSVSTFKTSPFVPAPRAHMLKHVCAWCRYTRGRFERTHGDVLSGHTGFYSVSHTTHHTAHTHHNTSQHNNTTTTPHGDRERDRQRRQGQREERTERRDKTRQKKTRQDKREKIHFQCGGAWPLFVGVVIFWLIPFAHETRFCISANYLFYAVTVSICLKKLFWLCSYSFDFFRII